jgi:hypothetical protein
VFQILIAIILNEREREREREEENSWQPIPCLRDCVKAFDSFWQEEDNFSVEMFRIWGFHGYKNKKTKKQKTKKRKEAKNKKQKQKPSWGFYIIQLAIISSF